MLASLLPGLRQVRTPLAVGYLWVLDLWLIFADDLRRYATVGPVGDVFALAGFFSKAAVLAAISFSAYLIGSLNIVSPTSVLYGILLFRLRLAMPRRLFFVKYPQRRRALPSVPPPLYRVIWELRQRQGAAPNDWIDESTQREVVLTALAVRPDLRTKLLIADKELYTEYDRLESEAEFRLNIALPLAGLFGILAWQLNVLWLFGLVPVAMIFWQGTNREFEALAILIRAILVGKIKVSEAPGSQYYYLR